MTQRNGSELFQVLVLAAILDGNKVLIIRRAKNAPETPDLHWSLPGGEVEAGQSLEEGLTREVEEETGLHVAAQGLLHARIIPHTNILALYYRCSLRSDHTQSIRVNTEDVTEFEWATGPQVLSRFTSDVAEPLANLPRRL